MNEKKTRPEDSKVSTSVEFVLAVFDAFVEREVPPDAARALTAITVLDLRLYDIMRSLDALGDIIEEK